MLCLFCFSPFLTCSWMFSPAFFTISTDTSHVVWASFMFKVVVILFFYILYLCDFRISSIVIFVVTYIFFTWFLFLFHLLYYFFSDFFNKLFRIYLLVMIFFWFCAFCFLCLIFVSLFLSSLR